MKSRWLRLRPLGAAALATAALLFGAAAGARDVTVSPTSGPGDYAAVKSALAGLARGDTLTLAAGVFDWSANVADSTGVPGPPGGLPVTVSGVVIRGRAGTILRGPADSNGHALSPDFGTSAAFRNGPGVNDVTLRDLTLERFENAILLLQSDSLASATPHDVFKDGTRGWTLENLHVRAGPYGISANGGHTALTIRRCRFEMEPTPGGRGSFAVGVRPFPPSYRGLPKDVTVEDCYVRGPEELSGRDLMAGIIVTADSARVRRNTVEHFIVGLVLEGEGFQATGNSVSRCGLGVVLWTTGLLGTQTKGAHFTGNEVRGMSRRQGGGILASFMGSGVLLAGVTGSEVANNVFSANAGADIVVGTVRTTPPSIGNRIAGNGGVVLLSKTSMDANQVDGSKVMVRDLSRPGDKAPAPEKTPEKAPR